MDSSQVIKRSKEFKTNITEFLEFDDDSCISYYHNLEDIYHERVLATLDLLPAIANLYIETFKRSDEWAWMRDEVRAIRNAKYKIKALDGFDENEI